MNPEPGPDLGCAALLVNTVTFVVVVGCVTLLFRLDVPVFQRGFFCDDETIHYPYKSDTVTVAMLFCMTVIPAVLAIILSRAVSFYVARRDHKLSSVSLTSGAQPDTWKAFILTIIGQIILLLFGFCLTLIVTEMCKISMGRLRPHFMDICRPKPGSYNCSQGAGYVTEYTCTQENAALLLDSRKSFLSGHASISFFFLIFTAVYTGQTICYRYCLPKALLQTLCVSVAVYVALSRLTDNMHHPTDVIAGALLGTLFGYIAAKRMFVFTFGANSKNLQDIQLQSVKAY